MKHILTVLVCSAVAVFVFGVTGCDLFGKDIEEDDLPLEDVQQIYYDNDQGDSISDDGYTNGAGPFIVPKGYGNCNGANIRIDAQNDSAVTKKISLGFSASDVEDGNAIYGNDIYFVLQPGEQLGATYLIRLNDVPGGTNLRLWNDRDSAGADSVADVTISGDVVYWIFNVVSVN